MALIYSPFFTCLSYRIKKREKRNDFQINQITQTYTKHAVTTETGFLLDITEWIRVLKQRICHQTTLT